MIRDIIAQLGKIAVTSLKLGREVAKEKTIETVDALKQGRAAHWLHDTLVRLGVTAPDAAPAPKTARKAPARTRKPAAPGTLPARSPRHHAMPAAHH